MNELDTINAELNGIEEQYRGQPFNAMPPATQACYHELADRFEAALFKEMEEAED